jgi:hypothetical protein
LITEVVRLASSKITDGGKKSPGWLVRTITPADMIHCVD